MKKRILCALLASALMVSAFAACSTEGDAGDTTDTSTPDATDDGGDDEEPDDAGGDDTATAAGPGSISYPLDVEQPSVIEYWKPLSGDLARKEGITSDNGTAWAEELQARTGVEIEFINPALGQDKEAFNLLLASGDLPDIIERPWLHESNGYPSGPDDAIRKNLVYDMTEVIEEWAPDFIDYIRNNGDLDRKFRTDEGRYWGMGFIRESSELCIWRGPVVRGDLLAEYGIDLPETIDDWTAMLTTFKDEGVELPISINEITNFINDGAFCAWGAKPDIYQVDGQVVYGPIEEGFEEVLLLLRGWYEAGLLDKNFVTNDGTILNTLITSGKAGSTIGNTGGGIGAWTPALKENFADATLVAAPYPVLNEGDTPMFGQNEQDFYANYIVATVDPDSENIEAAVKLLNYGYTEEGDMFMNYGIEGETYNMIDGYPTMVDEIALAADNKAEWSYYARSPYNGVMVQRVEYLEQLLVLPEQVDALTIWDNDFDQYTMPPVTQTVDEGSEFSRVYTPINDYYLEFATSFIIGNVSEDSYETEFVPTVNEMGIDRALELRQAALDRYNAR